MQSFDVAVIGAGPGGYVAAIRSSQLGLKTVCIDKWVGKNGKPSLGGTCLNVGCIPSKALLESSENYEHALESFASHGIRFEGLRFDLDAMLARKNKIVETHTGGISFLFKKNKVASLHGHARFLSCGQTTVLDVEGEKVEARHVIVATGSAPKSLPSVPFDNEYVVDNEGALSFKEVPRRLGIIGAGVIGLELGSVWRRLGSEVTLLEAAPSFLPMADADLSKEALRIFQKNKGWTIHTGIKLDSVKKIGKEVEVNYDGQTQRFDRLIVAVGRSPNTQGLALDAAGVRLDDRGYIAVDACCRTSAPNIYAIGDVVRGPMLAHKASEEGIMVAERISGQKTEVDLENIPFVIYTRPEIAWVGKTEAQLREGQYRKGRFPFSANGRAQAKGETSGFVKVLSDAKTDRILGMHIVGPCAAELIAEAVVAMEFKASSEDLARIVHAHPSLSEAIHEAALAAGGRSLHI